MYLNRLYSAGHWLIFKIYMLKSDNLFHWSLKINHKLATIDRRKKSNFLVNTCYIKKIATHTILWTNISSPSTCSARPYLPGFPTDFAGWGSSTPHMGAGGGLTRVVPQTPPPPSAEKISDGGGGRSLDVSSVSWNFLYIYLFPKKVTTILGP